MSQPPYPAQPFPPPAQQPVAPPSSIRIAGWLMYAAAGMVLVLLIVILGNMIREYAAGSKDTTDMKDFSNFVVRAGLLVLIPAFIGVLGGYITALIVLARFIFKGKEWARLIHTIVTGCVAFIVGATLINTAEHEIGRNLMSWLFLGVLLTSVVLLWLKSSSAFFRASQQPAPTIYFGPPGPPQYPLIH